eukprot:m.296685 g.296685  ORF g.296685 m.296685 type:complete len:97 (-) comp20071_c0_seq4:385-675(-)
MTLLGTDEQRQLCANMHSIALMFCRTHKSTTLSGSGSGWTSSSLLCHTLLYALVCNQIGNGTLQKTSATDFQNLMAAMGEEMDTGTEGGGVDQTWM